MAATLIGYTSPYLPLELIWACGCTPIRLRPGNSMAGADGYLPRNFSVEARALLAAALEHELQLDAVVFLDEDDTSRRLYDVWRAYADIPTTSLVALPRLNTDLACRRYANALTELGDELAGISGQPLTFRGLGDAIDLYSQQREQWSALRQAWVDGLLSSTEWYDLRWLALTTDPITANRELAERVASTSILTTPAGGEDPRLLVLGGMQVPRSLLAFLESCGARVAAEDSEADERTLWEAVPYSSDSDLQSQLETLAAAYLNKPPGPRPSALQRRLDLLIGLLEERHVQGVIALYPKFADGYLAEFVMLEELFRSRGLPTLVLEDDGESGLSGQQRTRIEALLEVIT